MERRGGVRAADLRVERHSIKEMGTSECNVICPVFRPMIVREPQRPRHGCHRARDAAGAHDGREAAVVGPHALPVVFVKAPPPPEHTAAGRRADGECKTL
jgi:hypothetical protein